MNRSIAALSLTTLLGIVPALSGSAHAEEGMWPLTDLPRERLRQRYNFEPSDDWLTHVQRAAVRLGNGCSGSFVSGQGLVMTNHHCAVSCITEHSSAGQDLMKNGFYAQSRETEKRCTGLEINQLMEVEDVTSYIHGAIKPGMGKIGVLLALESTGNAEALSAS